MAEQLGAPHRDMTVLNPDGSGTRMISTSWIRDYVPSDVASEELAGFAELAGLVRTGRYIEEVMDAPIAELEEKREHTVVHITEGALDNLIFADPSVLPRPEEAATKTHVYTERHGKVTKRPHKNIAPEEKADALRRYEEEEVSISNGGRHNKGEIDVRKSRRSRLKPPAYPVVFEEEYDSYQAAVEEATETAVDDRARYADPKTWRFSDDEPKTPARLRDGADLPSADLLFGETVTSEEAEAMQIEAFEAAETAEDLAADLRND